MRVFRVLAIAALLVGFGALQLAAAAEVAKPAAATMTAPAKRGPVTIVKAKVNPAVVIAAGTGVQGNIKLDGALTPQLSTMKCSDIMVLIGKYITPPASTSTTINIPTFEEVASNMAAGDIASGTCTYKVTGVPTSTQYTVLMNAHPPGVHCDVVYLDEKPYQAKLTFKPGQMQTQNYVVKPGCTVVK